MKCKYCTRDIPDESIYCMYCGERVARKRREKKQEPKYPKPRTLADGSLLGQLMINGKRETVKAKDEQEYKARIDAYRARVLEIKEHPEKRTLKEIIRSYIDKNDGVLSPATIRGYEYIYKGRFKGYIDKPAGKIDWQRMINDEAKSKAPKTVANSWALVTAALRDARISVPDVNLPAVPESDGDFLDYDEIKAFLEAVKNEPCELAALLMLHSLRMSEVLNLDAEDVQNGKIRVRGAVVRDKDNKLVEKETNKNRTSTRTIDIMIPRLTELLPESGRLVTMPPTTITSQIERACKKAKVTVCTPHDLRRSFASLGYHLKWSERAIMAVGGWNSLETVHRIYVKLSEKDVNADVKNMQNYYGFTTKDKKSAE